MIPEKETNLGRIVRLARPSAESRGTIIIHLKMGSLQNIRKAILM